MLQHRDSDRARSGIAMVVCAAKVVPTQALKPNSTTCFRLSDHWGGYIERKSGVVPRICTMLTDLEFVMSEYDWIVRIVSRECTVAHSPTPYQRTCTE